MFLLCWFILFLSFLEAAATAWWLRCRTFTPANLGFSFAVSLVASGRASGQISFLAPLKSHFKRGHTQAFVTKECRTLKGLTIVSYAACRCVGAATVQWFRQWTVNQGSRLGQNCVERVSFYSWLHQSRWMLKCMALEGWLLIFSIDYKCKDHETWVSWFPLTWNDWECQDVTESWGKSWNFLGDQ